MSPLSPEEKPIKSPLQSLNEKYKKQNLDSSMKSTNLQDTEDLGR